MNERIKKVSKNAPVILTEKQEKEIYTMFFGPYKEEWKDKKGIVDNSDSAIAKRMKLSTFIVNYATAKICKEHFDRIEKLYKAK